mmetsp:Transcript_145415/g.405302  ORF Transcript_145415/g.405302 Transcript_145415/m.405302 type:complete len:95 (+) Transcript_145415:113-397(+)
MGETLRASMGDACDKHDANGVIGFVSAAVCPLVSENTGGKAIPREPSAFDRGEVEVIPVNTSHPKERSIGVDAELMFAPRKPSLNAASPDAGFA